MERDARGAGIGAAVLERILATARDDQRRERWEERTNLPLLILAAAMLPLLLLQFLANVDQRTDDWLELASWLIWAVFAVDLGVRFWFAEHRRRFLIRNWIDVLIVAIPFLRPLRLLRIVIVLARIWRLLDRRGGARNGAAGGRADGRRDGGGLDSGAQRGRRGARLGQRALVDVAHDGDRRRGEGGRKRLRVGCSVWW